MQRFVIIDGNAILHRAFHAMPPLTTSSGEMVNAVYGFASMLFKVRDDLKPDYLAVTFDLPAPTFRKKMFADYQVQRPEMDMGLVGQIEKVKEMVRILGVPIYECSGFEADDVIGTLAAQALKIRNPKLEIPTSPFGLRGASRNKSKIRISNDQNDSDPLLVSPLLKGRDEVNSPSEKGKDIEIVIVTGDRDILQLVDETTKVYMPVKGLSETVMYDREKVKEKLGIYPELIPDYKGLVGDPSDNYQGVEGIGPKTAVDLLVRYGDFKGVYRSLEEIKGSVRDKLERGKESGEMSFKLATIVKDVPLELDLKNCRIKDFNTEEARGFFEKMESRSLIKRLARGTTGITGTTGKTTKKEGKDEDQMSLF